MPLTMTDEGARLERKRLDTLRVGFIGTGFIAAFHLQSMLGVRNVQVTGVYSRSAERRAAHRR
jgi:predicted dehydrogenase